MKLKFVIVFFLFYLQLSTLVDSVVFKVIPFFFFLFILLQSSWKQNLMGQTLAFFRNNKALLLYVILVFISSIRTNNPNFSISSRLNRTVSFILFILIILSYLFKELRKKKIYKANDYLMVISVTIIFPLMLYGIVNIILLGIGISFHDSVQEDYVVAQPMILSALGVKNIGRVAFPLVSGFNPYALLLGSVFVLSMMLYFNKTFPRSVYLYAALLFFVQLLLIDTRSAIFFPVIVMLYLWWLNKKMTPSRLNLFKFLPLLILLGPVLYIVVLPLIAQRGIADSIARNSEDIEGNIRFIIWGVSFAYFLNFRIEHLWGYGEFGQYASRVSQKWAEFLPLWKDADMTSPHNSMLSILFDTGYIGVFIYILVFVVTINRIVKYFNYRKKNSYIYISFIMVTILTGITDVNGGFYTQNNYLYVFLIVLIVEAIEAGRIQTELKTTNYQQ